MIHEHITVLFSRNMFVFCPIFTFLLYWQVDPLEKLDPEVADILVEIAENFLESVSISILFYCVNWTDVIVHIFAT